MDVDSKVILFSTWVGYKEVILDIIIIDQWESYGGQNYILCPFVVYRKIGGRHWNKTGHVP